MDTGAYYSRVTPLIPSLTGIDDDRGLRHSERPRAGHGVFTNKVWSEPYRGAGRPEAAYLIERAMDVLARELGLHPAEVRRRTSLLPIGFPTRPPPESPTTAANTCARSKPR